jgi:hypothetical protein
MDPYLERLLWPDLHQRLAAHIAGRLTPRLRPRYVARLSTRFVAETDEGAPAHILYPDVDIVLARPVQEVIADYRVGVAPAPPFSMPALVLPQPSAPRAKVVSIHVRDAQSNRLVTAIEILSPVNKRAEGWFEYHQKRWRVLDSGAHLLEIDLLRSGARPVALDRASEEERPLLEKASYFFFLTRSGQRDRVETWPVALRDPLPVLPVPLLEPDPDVALELGAALNTVYDEAAYDLSIDYRQPPDPPLAGEDAAWADALLREKGLRRASGGPQVG